MAAVSSEPAPLPCCRIASAFDSSVSDLIEEPQRAIDLADRLHQARLHRRLCGQLVLDAPGAASSSSRAVTELPRASPGSETSKNFRGNATLPQRWRVAPRRPLGGEARGLDQRRRSKSDEHDRDGGGRGTAQRCRAAKRLAR